MRERLVPSVSKLNLPGKDLFEALETGEMTSPGIVLNAKIAMDPDDGRYGTFVICRGEIGCTSSAIQIGSRENGVESFEFAYEHPNYPEKDQQPYQRDDHATKIDKSWDQLYIVTLPSGGRVFFSKSPDINQGVEIYRPDIPNLPTRYYGLRYFKQNEGALVVECVEKLARSYLNLQDEEAKVIANEIKSRLSLN